MRAEFCCLSACKRRRPGNIPILLVRLLWRLPLERNTTSRPSRVRQPIVMVRVSATMRPSLHEGRHWGRQTVFLISSSCRAQNGSVAEVAGASSSQVDLSWRTFEKNATGKMVRPLGPRGCSSACLPQDGTGATIPPPSAILFRLPSTPPVENLAEQWKALRRKKEEQHQVKGLPYLPCYTSEWPTRGFWEHSRHLHPVTSSLHVAFSNRLPLKPSSCLHMQSQ